MKERIGAIAPFGLRIPHRIKDWVLEQAEKQDRSMNYVILRILEREMAATGEKFGDPAPAAAETSTR